MKSGMMTASCCLESLYNDSNFFKVIYKVVFV